MVIDLNQFTKELLLKLKLTWLTLVETKSAIWSINIASRKSRKIKKNSWEW
jgi:hypothetical protein